MYKIMLADDEGIVIDALSFIIQKNFGDSCMIESAKTGRSVIELAERFRPDIAFMDIQMTALIMPNRHWEWGLWTILTSLSKKM